MKAALALVAAALLLPFGIHASEIEPLIERIKHTKNTDDGVSKAEDAVARKLQAIGPKAIPYLLPLLKDPNEHVREAAGYTLRDIKGLQEEDLDALTSAFQGDGGWLAPAIASISTPRAIDFLVAQLIRERRTQSQLTEAIKRLGSKAVPPLLHVFQTDDGWDSYLEQTMYTVFQDLGSEATSAVEPLLKIAGDDKAHQATRIHAIQTLGSIGLAAESAVPYLQKLSQGDDPELRSEAASAIVSMGTVASAQILTQMLVDGEATNRPQILRNIARLGVNGISAGATVTKFVTAEDFETRVCAVRTLGYIVDRESGAVLIQALDCVEDWRVVYCAAWALEQLEIKEALPALAKVSSTHWYPPVREAATKAMQSIRSGKHRSSRNSPDNFYTEFFAFQRAGQIKDRLKDEEIDRTKFPTVAINTNIPPEVLTNPKIKEPKGDSCGIKLSDGYLVGRDRGEWGGEIEFVDFAGNRKTVFEANTSAIFETKDGIYAMIGLGYGGTEGGVIYKLQRGPEGEWQTRAWRALPGSPGGSRLLQDGRFFINSYNHGITLVSPDGKIEWLTPRQLLRVPGKRH